MYIMNMEVENYRTFRHIRLVFDKSLNYIVGANRIGKTNFLALLEALHERYRFLETDFLDPDRPIRVFMKLKMDVKKTLLFRGEPLDDEDNIFHVEITQAITDLSPKVKNIETGEELPTEWLRSVRYLSHVPHRFRRRGIELEERFRLRKASEEYFASRGPWAVKKLKEMAVRCGANPNEMKTVIDSADSWVNFLLDYKIKNPAVGHEFHTLISAGFQLLTELLELRDSRAVSWERNLIIDEQGRRFLPLIVSIDEPEIHLHPYLQRSLLDFYRKILDNENELMNDIFSYSLGIDGVEGQLFIVTNSTDSLVDDYRNIIRLYRNEYGEVRAACGAEFSFSPDVEKHLIMHFPEVKEALYARSVLIVEGETEYGAFKGFAKTMGINFDFLGICLVNARGESSIEKIAQLFKSFNLGTVALYDNDVRGKALRGKNIFFTEELCFELDIVLHCLRANKLSVLRKVVRRIDGGDGYVNREMTRKAAGKWKPDEKRFFTAKKLKNISGRDRDGLAFYYFAWLFSKKGVIVGRVLAEFLTLDLIPQSFQRAIRRAAELTR